MLIYIAKDVVKKPVYLVYGHDEGALSIKVLDELKKRSDINQMISATNSALRFLFSRLYFAI
jgi:hypothetical protein